jgi:Raf kinase inhibitor-like YbhB/YbcL family protein
VPKGTANYALILHDIDIALDRRPEDGLRWIVWNIPGDANGIPESRLPAGPVVGRNVEQRNEYLGPGAPAGARFHHYMFEFFALDRTLALPVTTARAALLAALEGKIIDKAAYVGRFKRRPGVEYRRA